MNLSKSLNSGLRNLADASINAAKNKRASSPEGLQSYSICVVFFCFFVVFFALFVTTAVNS